jgi:general secretion pathway protein J
MNSGTKQQLTGFTLLELLVAVAVFAILSAMAYGGLRNVIDNSQQTESAMERLQQVQMTMLKICLLYTSPSPRDRQKSRMPSSA